MPALGERFRAAREARGLTLSDVSEQLRIRAVYLAAIEEENWQAIGAAVYARGFLRTYARFLGLDPEESVAAFNASSGAATPASTAPAAVPAEPPPSIASSRQGLSPVIWIASLIAIALVAYVVYNAMTLSRPNASGEAAGTVAASASPLPSNSASPGPGATDIAAAGASAAPAASPSPAGPNTLELHFTSASWLRVSVDGGASIEGTFPAGTVKTFHGKTVTVRVGNAAGVEAFVDGKSVGVLGKAGDVVDRTFTL
ncbi:MAG TPA: RodZ domain-containing protein [Candidatus Baltobacteraceae bacterium]|jgi:transcriptional regulator with XRE-family HTH domain